MILVPPRLAGQSGTWLLELEAGHAIRLATRPCTAGGYAWRGGLSSPTISTAQASISLEVVGVDWPALIAAGLEPGLLRGRLWLWHEGQELDQAWLVRSGPVEAPDLEAASSSATLTLGAGPWEDVIELPPATAVVDESTWPVRSSPSAYEVPETVAGSPYPLVIGQPGTRYTVGGGARVLSPATPAYLVESWQSLPLSSWLASRLLVAGHPVSATSVRVVDVSAGTSEVRSVSTTTDRHGRAVSYVDWTGSTTTAPNPEHEYWISWDQGGGGVIGDDREAVRGLGTLLAYLFGTDLFRGDVRASVPFDMQAQRGWAAILDRFKIDACISGATTAWALASELAELVPMRWVWGRGGGVWVPLRYDATAADAVGAIRIGRGQGAERIGTVRYPDLSSLPTELVLEYSPEGQTYAKRARLTTSARAAVAATQTPAAEPSALCDAAWSRRVSRLGPTAGLSTWTKSTRMVADDATALAMLRLQAARLCTPPATCTVRGARALGAYGGGAVVLVTDDLAWTDRVALVTEARTDGQMWELELDVLNEPLRRGVA